jgi:tetratricopeptide (TPR) repeat protein
VLFRSLEATEATSDGGRWLHDAWTRYIAALGRDRLTIVAIEDIHWASDPLLDVLDHVAEFLSDTRVVLVFPTRPELLEGRRSWGGGRQNATSLTIPPLQPSDAATLAGSLLGDAVSAELRESVLARAEGNPFFVEELLRMLIENGALQRANGRWRLTKPIGNVRIPDSIHGVIAARLDLLDADARDALRRCAVVGRVFWPEAVGVDREHVEILVRRDLVRAAPESSVAELHEFAFKHALTQEVAYGSLPRAERRVLHRRVGDWVLSVAPDRTAETAELAAYHLVQAIEYGDDDPALKQHAFDVLMQAGASSLARGAAATAAHHFDRAAELSAGRDRAAALTAHGRALIAQTRLEEAIAVLERAHDEAVAAVDAALIGDALGWSSRAKWLRGEWRAAIAAADAAVDALNEVGDSPQLARALARRSQLAMLRDAAEAIPQAEAALEVARRVGDPLAEVNARVNLFSARSNHGDAVEVRELRACMDLALAAGAPDEAYRAVVNWLWSVHAYTPLPQVAAELEHALGGLEPFPAFESFGPYLALSIARFVHVPMGDWSAVEATLAEPDGVVGARMLWLDLAGGMALRRGDMRRAREYTRVHRQVALESDEPQRVGPMLAVAIPYAAAAGDEHELRELVDILLARGERDWIPATPMTTIPRAVAAAGQIDLLRRVRDVLEALPAGRRRWNCLHASVIANALVARADGRADEAVDALTAAVADADAYGRRYDAACLRLDLAQALEAAGRHDDAARTDATARTYLDALGCVNPY